MAFTFLFCNYWIYFWNLFEISWNSYSLYFFLIFEEIDLETVVFSFDIVDIDSFSLSLYLLWAGLFVDNSLFPSPILISSYSSMFPFEIIESYEWTKSVFYSSSTLFIFSKFIVSCIFNFYKNGSDILFKSCDIICFYNSNFALIFFDS